MSAQESVGVELTEAEQAEVDESDLYLAVCRGISSFEAQTGQYRVALSEHVTLAVHEHLAARQAPTMAQLIEADGWEGVDTADLMARAVDAIAWGLLEATSDTIDREPSEEAFTAARATAERVFARRAPTVRDRKAVARAVAEHAFGEVLGDNDHPEGKRFTCRCGWEHRVDGMSGWRSWYARHGEHVADVVLALPGVAQAPTVALAVMAEVVAERQRQDEKWGEQNHPNGTGGLDHEVRASIARAQCNEAATEGRVTYRHILTEEVAEAYAESDPNKLRDELIQVAAVAVAWVEKLDRAERIGGEG